MENIMTTDLYCLIYISSAYKLMDSDELSSILTKSKKNNDLLNITGMLIYSGGNIIQVLEGEKSSVEDLYSKIKLDPRHFGIIKLMGKLIDRRCFGEWSMGFRTINEVNMAHLKAICQIDSFGQIASQISIVSLVKNFLINNA